KHVGSDKPICPGQAYQHYAPLARLILDEKVSPESVGAVVGFSDRKYPASCRFYSLGGSTNPQEVAKNLYEVLRRLDRDAVAEAWVDMEFPQDGLWRTVAE